MDRAHEGGGASTRLTGRRLAAARAAWLGLAGLILTLFVLGIPASYARAAALSPAALAGLAQLGLPAWLPPLYVITLDGLTMAGCAAIAILLFWRRADDWLALFVGLMLLLTGMLYTAPAYEAPAPMWLIAVLSALAEICQVTFVYLFPNGRFAPRRMWLLLLPLLAWRPLIWGLVYLPGYYANPPAGERYPYLAQDARDVAAVLALFAAGILAQVYRYRRVSSPAERQQTKWLLVGLMATVAVVGGYVILVNTLAAGGPQGLFLRLAGRTVRQVALLLVPISLAYSILRYRLWDIDILLRRTLVYGLLTALLAGTYAVSVIVLQAFFRLLTGAGSGLAVVVSTLGSAVLFSPLRERVQLLIDRRFYRRKYNATQTIRVFGLRLREEVDLDALAGDLLSVVSETVQPAHLSLWLARQSGDRTSLSGMDREDRQ